MDVWTDPGARYLGALPSRIRIHVVGGAGGRVEWKVTGTYEVVVASTVDDAFGTARPGIEQARGQFQRLAATDLPSFESSKASTWPFKTH